MTGEASLRLRLSARRRRQVVIVPRGISADSANVIRTAMLGITTPSTDGGFLDAARATADRQASASRRNDGIEHVAEEQRYPELALVTSGLKLALSDLQGGVDGAGIRHVGRSQVREQQQLHRTNVVLHLVETLLCRRGHESHPSDLSSDAADRKDGLEAAHRLCGDAK